MKNEDISTLALCAVRYCFGRQTYMPSLVMDIIKANLGQIDNKTISCLERDVRDRIADHDKGLQPIGDDCDYRNWQDFYRIIEAERVRRNLERWN